MATLGEEGNARNGSVFENHTTHPLTRIEIPIRPLKDRTHPPVEIDDTDGFDYKYNYDSEESSVKDLAKQAVVCGDSMLFSDARAVNSTGSGEAGEMHDLTTDSYTSGRRVIPVDPVQHAAPTDPSRPPPAVCSEYQGHDDDGLVDKPLASPEQLRTVLDQFRTLYEETVYTVSCMIQRSTCRALHSSRETQRQRALTSACHRRTMGPQVNREGYVGPVLKSDPAPVERWDPAVRLSPPPSDEQSVGDDVLSGMVHSDLEEVPVYTVSAQNPNAPLASDRGIHQGPKGSPPAAPGPHAAAAVDAPVLNLSVRVRGARRRSLVLARGGVGQAVGRWRGAPLCGRMPGERRLLPLRR